MKKPLTAQEIAALAAGAPALVEGTTEVTPTTPETKAETTPEEEPAPAATTTEPAAASQDAGLVAYLQSQVTAKDASLLTMATEMAGLKAQLEAANAKVTSMEATHTALVTIAAQSTRNMRVALNMADVNMTKMNADAVLAEHTASAEAFNKAFKAGGVAAAAQPSTPAAKAPAQSGAAAARIAATKV